MKTCLFLIVAWTLIAQPVAHAGTALFSGSGTWGDDAPVSIYTAPDATWAFSFVVPNPLEANPTTMATDFQYLLNGSSITTTLTSVEFFAQSDGGLFDLNFDDGNSLNLYGAQVLATSNLTLLAGIYTANIDINSFIGPPDGTGAGAVSITLVPEPSSIVLALIALVAVGGQGFVRTRRRINSEGLAAGAAVDTLQQRVAVSRKGR
jgi:PEP-CTERM motif